MSQSEVLEFVEKVIRIPSLTLCALSQDGRSALFLSDLSGSYQLWSADTSTGKLAQVSHGDQRVSFAEISPDSKSVAFIRDFEGAERHQFFLVPITGMKEEVQVSDLKDVRVSEFDWSPDGTEIAVAGCTATDQCLWTLNPKTKTHEELYSSHGYIFSPAYSPDGKRIAAMAKTTDAPRSSELLVLHRRTGEVNLYSPKLGSENATPKWHPKGRRLLFKTNAKGKYDLAVYDHSEQKLTYLNALRVGVDFISYGWMPKGDAVWFVAVRNGRTRLYIQNKEGDLRLVPTPIGKIDNAKLNKGGSFFIFSWSSLSNPPQLAKLDLKTKKVSTIYSPRYDKGLPLGISQFMTYGSLDGLKIPAFMLFSGSRRPKPLVIWPHGGPWWEVADEWNPVIQSICMAGFHVFCPNFRGSTGYGAEFERMDIGDAGGKDFQDVLAGVKFVREKGFVDDGRIAITGASYGGFMTFLAMTKEPGLWKAGAAIVGITDWKEMYDLSDALYRDFVVDMLGKPEENAELYRDRSAINFVSQIEAPILIWHRANDSRAPLLPVQRFASKLQALGKPYEFHVVEGEGHGAQKTDNLVKQYRHVVSFLLKNLS